MNAIEQRDISEFVVTDGTPCAVCDESIMEHEEFLIFRADGQVVLVHQGCAINEILSKEA